MRCLSYKIILYSFVLFLHVCATNGQRKGSKRSRNPSNRPVPDMKCNNQSLSRLDTHLHKLMSNKFPANNRELRLFCNQGFKSLNYGQKYVKKCLLDFSQKAVSVLLFPIRKELNSICKSGRISAKAKELITASKCGNAARPGLRKCYRSFIKSELVALKAERKKQMPIICCEFNKLTECFKSEAEEEKVCTPRTIDSVEKWSTQIFGQIISLMCTEYTPDSDRCEKVLNEMPKIDLTSVKQPKSFLSPIIQIVSVMGE